MPEQYLTDLAPSTTVELADWIHQHPRLLVLTGAGISTASGIPDYRDEQGQWKLSQPVEYQDFISHRYARQRYWARSLNGWPRFNKAQPNRAHQTLAQLEQMGFVHQLVTQNVDGLHQKAGHRRVLDLHGRLDIVECLSCKQTVPRAEFQQQLTALNPDFVGFKAQIAPDGDAQLEHLPFEEFIIPPCPKCDGILKPRVVFFGETIPKPRVERALQRLQQADALLTIGTSLMVYSGFRFCKHAASQNKSIAAINLGKTRADDLLTLKIQADCTQSLEQLLTLLN